MPISITEAVEQLTRSGQFEMQQAKIFDRSVRIWRNAPASLREIFEKSIAFGDRTYIVYEDERLTYANHADRVCRLATVLVERYGIRKGDRVVLAMRNLPEWPIVFWATVSVGAIVVPLNAWWTGPELEYGIQDSGSRVLVADSQRLERIRPHLPELSLDAIIVSRHTGPLEPGVEDLNHVIESAPQRSRLPSLPIAPDDEATIFYTSGTTGKPKGVLGTHRNLVTNVFNYDFMTAFSELRRGFPVGTPSANHSEPSAALLCVPLFHVTGCHSTLAINTFAGNKIVLMHKWDPGKALELIQREKINSFGGVPTIIWQITETPGIKLADVSSIKSLFYGGALSGPEIVSRIESAFPGAQPSTGYGLTEISSIGTAIAGIDYQRKPQSVGLPAPVVDIRIVGENGRDLQVGQSGEIWIKGPNVMKGYWKLPEATAEVITDGWMHSGDLGYMDEEGFVFLAGRINEMIIRGGENVYCAEVERALFSLDAVMDAAVFGMPDRVLGEEVAAVVQIRPGHKLMAAQLRAHVATQVAGYKVPALIELREEPLIRNAAGKIMKGELKKNFAGQRVDGVNRQ
jgi:long-chain acyl-CoA synthetase